MTVNILMLILWIICLNCMWLKGHPTNYYLSDFIFITGTTLTTAIIVRFIIKPPIHPDYVTHEVDVDGKKILVALNRERLERSLRQARNGHCRPLEDIIREEELHTRKCERYHQEVEVKMDRISELEQCIKEVKKMAHDGSQRIDIILRCSKVIREENETP